MDNGQLELECGNFLHAHASLLEAHLSHFALADFADRGLEGCGPVLGFGF